MSKPSSLAAIDPTWFRRILLDDILPRWLRHAVTDEGLFLPQLDRQWRRKENPFGTVVTQARLLYSFATGYELTGRGEYRDAAAAGARFLLDKFRDPEHGGWFHAVGPDGRVVEDRKDSYDHAFVIFGLSHAFRATREAAFKAGALEALALIRDRFTDRHGGLVRRMTRDFRPDETRRTQNPVMHLFEALLALGDIDARYYADAKRIGEFVLSRLIQGRSPAGLSRCSSGMNPALQSPHSFESCRAGITTPSDPRTGEYARREVREPPQDDPVCLPEFYTMEWEPLPIEQGGLVNVGHQFEWAYLLSAAAERGLPAEWLVPARRLLDYGLLFGLDSSTGGVIGSTTYDGKPLSVEKGWWEQCEAIRALLRHTTAHGRADAKDPLARLIRFVQDRFVDTTFGGIYSNIEEVPTDSIPDKGSPWKVDYHTVGMCVEALRLTSRIDLHAGSG